ncbi:MAG: hypothetical protein E7241_01190 [Lachnospiraceae bacterium]|nr:hypothetical protein [Lachnospiraceae bacterium]
MSGSNIRKYKKPIKFNMGIFIFGMIFLYFLAFGIFRFLKNGNVSSYVVNSGSLSDNVTFNALAIRQEKVFKADRSGALQLFVRENSKVGYGETVYTLDETGTLKAALANISTDESNLSDKDFEYFLGNINSFKQNFNSTAFSKVYDFKMSMEADILDSLSMFAVNNNKIDTSKFSIVKAETDGIIVYSYDGMEDVTLDNFTKDMVKNHKTEKKNSRAVEKINSGDVVYKLITDENWNLVMEIDDKFEEKIKDQKSIQIRFTDDSQFAWVNFNIINREGSKFLVLNIPNSAIRYAGDRYVKIEVQTSGASGLKVPKSALVSKNFYTIPKDFLTQGGSSGGNGFLKEKGGNDGGSVEFVDARIIFSDDKNCYVDMNTFESGIRLVKANTSETFTVGATASINGVYNINKGYAIFNSVTVLDENNEYCIISPNSTYGVKKYDYIALDGSSVKEDQIIH